MNGYPPSGPGYPPSGPGIPQVQVRISFIHLFIFTFFSLDKKKKFL